MCVHPERQANLQDRCAFQPQAGHTPHMPPPLSTTTPAGRLLPGAVSAPHHTRAHHHSATSLCPAGHFLKVGH